MNVTIIGLGLIGGSLAIDLKKRNFADFITGVDNNSLHANTAKQIGFIDKLSDLNQGIQNSDVIILATPVDATVKLLPNILNTIDNQVVIDMCSTKYSIIQSVKGHQKRGRFVAAHPMAGTEFNGPWAAVPELFDGKAVILCDADESDADAVDIANKLFNTLHMRVIYMGAQEHDIHAAYVSHISHISSFALALTVLEKEKDEKHIFNLASGGFDSTVRLAKSSPDMWAPIFLQNDTNVLTVLDTYIEKLRDFKKLIENGDSEGLHQQINTANSIRRILKK